MITIEKGQHGKEEKYLGRGGGGRKACELNKHKKKLKDVRADEQSKEKQGKQEKRKKKQTKRNVFPLAH